MSYIDLYIKLVFIVKKIFCDLINIVIFFVLLSQSSSALLLWHLSFYPIKPFLCLKPLSFFRTDACLHV